jgi:zinc D-Ala-D-Ala carboxypeptidase
MLTIARFTRTNTKGVNNSLPPELEPNYNRIKEWIDKLFTAFPNALLNSGYRSDALNRRIGGSATSYHKLALAADVDSANNNRAIFQWIIDNVPFDLVIWEKGNDTNPDWVHFQLAKDGQAPRRIIHRYHLRNGKWIYRPCDRNGKLTII